MAERRKVAIVGAGVAGLVTARTLLARGHECTVFERNARLGGVWSAGYANFGVQVQPELYAYPDCPHPLDTPDFPSGPYMQRYLEQYARAGGVWPLIRFDSAVTALTRATGGGDWQLAYRHGEESVEQRFDFVVICSGLYSNKPHVPVFPGQDTFGGEIMHVSALTDPARIAGKRVAVVGFGKSASDIALEASAVAASTCLAVRALHWPVPARLLGILPFKWAMLNRLTSTLLPLYYRPSRLERCVHTLGKPLVWAWWRLVECLLIAQYRLGSARGTRPSLVPQVPIEFDAFGEAVMLPRPEFYPKLRGGAIEALQGEIASFTPDGIRLTNGMTRELDCVILATGWETDYDYLAGDVLSALRIADDGLYLYRQMVHPDVADLAFVGYAATISSTLTYALQARWLADLLDARHHLPPAAAMHDTLAMLASWKRRSMPFSRGRAARLLLHMLHYHDELLADLGLSPLRKRGAVAPFKEVFAPYEPTDYRDLMGDAGQPPSG